MQFSISRLLLQASLTMPNFFNVGTESLIRLFFFLASINIPENVL